MNLDEMRWELLVLAGLWTFLLVILRSSKRAGRGWCPACTAPDLWVLSKETAATSVLGMSALAVPMLYFLALMRGGIPSTRYEVLMEVAAVAGMIALIGRLLRPSLRHCDTCGFEAELPKGSP